MSLDYVSNQEIIQAARRNLSQDVWDYLTGGAESETTMRRNRLGFDSLGLRPRVLVDVSKVDTSTIFLGQKLRIPVMMAPIGSLQTITPEGGAAVAKAAAEFGTMNFLSSVTQPSLEEVGACVNHPKIFQLYIRGGLDWCAEIVGRVKRAAYIALCLTVDTAHYSRRERPLLNRWQPPSRHRESGRIYQAMLTWEMAKEIKKIAGMPLIIKGIATAEDARLAVDHGVEVGDLLGQALVGLFLREPAVGDGLHEGPERLERGVAGNGGRWGQDSGTENPEYGAQLRYFLPAAVAGELRLRILDANGAEVRMLSSIAKPARGSPDDPEDPPVPPGVPLVRMKTACEGRDLHVDLAQSPFGAADLSDKRRWSVPVCMRNAANGRALGCTLLSEKATKTVFPRQCGAVVMPNMDGAGYYRFSMTYDEWQKLADSAPRMTPAEQLALLHSLRAAFRAGDVDAATYAGTFRALAPNAAWDVTAQAHTFLAELRGDLLPKADVPLFESMIVICCGPCRPVTCSAET